MFKVNNINSRKRCEICSNLTTKIPGRRHWRCTGVFIVNFEHVSYLFLVFLLLFEMLSGKLLDKQTHAQSKQYKHYKKVWNTFKVNDKDTKTTPGTLFAMFLLLTLNMYHAFHLFLVFVLLTLNRLMFFAKCAALENYFSFSWRIIFATNVWLKLLCGTTLKLSGFLMYSNIFRGSVSTVDKHRPI